ncbi:uncharacterized protein (DUF58 family) [Nocardioides aromaticivorans]|uniref:DUF58 domain-containing protein n=1 Tax=Nocardioides aromaticivorans TaxID=200618 RepID=A0A7Z0CLT9_9ACTN|nr:DUF58 domain-containing protein [Nocardioides aromaticivorans]NYI46111.1 uncharacterized protein (DUF58 family) [Nocardioides aromaticivorans]QSR25246.1 DUF58 domain-containing protein [Nocardioides aromaticivorans]
MPAHLPRIKARVSIHAHRKVRGLLEGEYAAVHVGRGIDFNDLREYVRGDDVKDIDWKASARSRQLLVKRYVAERKHTVLLCVSTGRSMAAMNDAAVSKRELTVFVAGLMGLLAVQHGDLVSLVHGDAAERHAEPPKGGELHLERLLGKVHDAIRPDGAPADLAALLRYVARTVRRRTILVVVCDDTHIPPESADLLRRLTVQHEVLLLTIGDLDPTLPAVAGRRLVDVDTTAEVPGWLRHDRRLRRELADLVGREEQQLRHRLDQLGVVHERVRDTDSAVTAVFRLLERQRHARRR